MNKILAAVIAIAVIVASVALYNRDAFIEKPKVEAAAASTATPAAKSDDPIIASVNGIPIYESDVGMLYQSLPEQYKRMQIQMIYGQLVSAIIDRKIIAQAAIKDGLEKEDQVQKRIRFYLEGVLQDRYLSLKVEKEMTEEKLRKIYDEMSAKQTPGDEVHARHILVEKEDTAKEIIKELEAGADFVELAKTKSTGPSGPRGGDLGFFEHKSMVPAFADAAFAMKAGESSKTAVKTEFGWHIIKVEERRPGKNPSFEDMQVEIRTNVGQKVSKALIEGLRKTAKIKHFDADGKEVKPAVATENKPTDEKPEAEKKN